MPVGLVAYIPNQLVIWGIQYVMQRYSELNYTQAGPEMTAVYGYHINDVMAQLFADLL